ncbi:hypothetical protein [Tsukamurella sp. PLM1]|uniref:hypothetical protein n=1 Tax=Tsukamurella sp. PLM1 TaxID=2929795 RepID=UPI002069FD99|nr:hypothetical protein [Tsukamurella sp. PLM1]BDH56120.1 hypothetical protein MTP03_10590 [Tsukamurella sp. PLM1]
MGTGAGACGFDAAAGGGTTTVMVAGAGGAGATVVCPGGSAPGLTPDPGAAEAPDGADDGSGSNVRLDPARFVSVPVTPQPTATAAAITSALPATA